MKTNRIRILGLMGCGIFAAAGWIRAENFAFVGARANGMGGANAASTGDASAQYHNPAAFGFFGRSEWATNAVDNGNLSAQGFSAEIFGIGAGFTMTEDMGRYLDILADIRFESFDQGNLSAQPDNVRSLLAVAGVLGSLNQNDALYADASAGASYQIGHFGVGIRIFGEMTAWTLRDTDNLSLDSFPNVAALVSELDAARGNDTGYVWDGSYILTPEQRSSIAAALDNIDVNGDTIKYLDDKLGQLIASGKLEGGELDQAVNVLTSMVPGAGGAIASNLTSVVGRGFTLVEIPVSYGWAVNENLSFGVTAKAMYGSVLGTRIWIFNENNDQVLENISDNVNSSLTVGLDAGVLYRLPDFQFALVGHNLNRPTFDGFTDTILLNGNPQSFSVPDVDIDPQFTVGAAYMPSRRFTLESSLDLLEVGTLLDGYEVQRFSVGTEFVLPVIALRLGTYKNLAESWQDWVLTAGIGADLFGMRVDLGGAYSLGDHVNYQSSNIPAEARLYLGIGLDF